MENIKQEAAILEKQLRFLLSAEIIAYAIASNEYLYKDIDEIYSEDEYRYFCNYSEKKFNDTFYMKLPLKQQDHCIKFLSILGGAEKNTEDEKKIIYIIKKGYKSVIRYLQRIKILDITDMRDYLAERKGITDTNSILVGIYILTFLSEEFNIDAYCDIIQNSEVIKSLYSYYRGLIILNDINANDMKVPHTNEGISYYKLKDKEECKIYDYFENLIEREEKNTASELNKIDYKESFDMYKKVRSTTLREGLFSKYIGTFSGILRSLNIDPNILSENYTINNKQIENSLAFFNIGDSRESLTDEEAARYIVTFGFLKCLAEELKETKKACIYSEKIACFERYKKLKEESNKIIEKKDREASELKAKNLKLENTNKELKKQVQELQRKLKRIELNTSNNTVNKVELDKLRQYVFNLSKDTPSADTIEKKYDLNFINSKKILILGGSPSWQNKIKEVLINCSFISMDNMRFDISTLSRYDHIFIYTGYLSHSLYYKVIDYIRDNNLNMDYLECSTNIDLFLKNIESALKAAVV